MKKQYVQSLIDERNESLPINYPIFKDGIEEDKKNELEVQGKIPSWLNGTFVRNAPGLFNIGNDHIADWFDGFAMLASFEFKKSKVYYQSAFIKSDQYIYSKNTKAINLNGYGMKMQEPEASHISFDGQKTRTANPNINVERVGTHYIALGETPLPVEFDLSTLSTKDIFDYSDRLKKADMWESAHMKRDPEDGALYNFYIDYGKTSSYVLYKINPGTTNRVLVARERTSEPSYMHDFSITKNYIILTAYPLVVSPIDLLKPNYSFIGAHRWEPLIGTKIYVFDKKSGALINKHITKPMFAFHHINAFEDDTGKINILLSATTNKADVYVVKVESVVITDPLVLPKLTRLEIDLQNSSSNIFTLSNETYELPTIHPNLIGNKNKYFYAVSYTSNVAGYGIVKYDIHNNKPLYWDKAGFFADEPLFIPNPNGKEEDDGIVACVINNNKDSYLLLLDAKNMKELARAKLPRFLPSGLHGKFFK